MKNTSAELEQYLAMLPQIARWHRVELVGEFRFEVEPTSKKKERWKATNVDSKLVGGTASTEQQAVGNLFETMIGRLEADRDVVVANSQQLIPSVSEDLAARYLDQTRFAVWKKLNKTIQYTKYQPRYPEKLIKTDEDGWECNPWCSDCGWPAIELTMSDFKTAEQIAAVCRTFPFAPLFNNIVYCTNRYCENFNGGGTCYYDLPWVLDYDYEPENIENY